MFRELPKLSFRAFLSSLAAAALVVSFSAQATADEIETENFTITVDEPIDNCAGHVDVPPTMSVYPVDIANGPTFDPGDSPEVSVSADWLNGTGCDSDTGNHISVPLTGDVFVAWSVSPLQVSQSICAAPTGCPVENNNQLLVTYTAILIVPAGTAAGDYPGSVTLTWTPD